MSRKMTYRQWELLSMIHDMKGSVPNYLVRDKSLANTCVKKGYLEQDTSGSLRLTDYGREMAKEDITSLDSNFRDE